MYMNEAIFYALTEVAIALAGFSGIAAAFRLRGENAWSPTELRVLWFLIIDSFLVVFLSFIPIALHLATVSTDLIWAVCSVLLAAWFIFGNLVVFQGERRKRVLKQAKTTITASLFKIITVIALIIALCLVLSAFDFLVPRGQAIYVGGLLALLAFAAVEFLFFIGRASISATEE